MNNTDCMSKWEDLQPFQEKGGGSFLYKITKKQVKTVEFRHFDHIDVVSPDFM